MKTYLELEGKLGSKFQPQPDQSRPTQPDTNPHMRKETKATGKRKKLIPTKKYKVKVVARPKSKTNNITAQPPVTTPNAPTNSDSQKPLQGTSESNPHHSKTSQLALAPHGQKTGKMTGNVFELGKEWLSPPTPTTITISKPPINVESQTQGQVNPSATAAPKAENFGWGLNCPI